MPGGGLRFLPGYDVNEALRRVDGHTDRICVFAIASHYLILAANVYRQPNVSISYADDGFNPVGESSGTDFFLRKAERYLADVSFTEVVKSHWPTLTILGQISGVA